jgi:CheY-like chemotaxis protein
VAATSRKPRIDIQHSVSLLQPRSLGKSDPADLNSAPPLALIVDDDPVFRTVVRAYLEEAGFRVDEAESGQGAIEKFEATPVDIVLLDILMPDMDGFETCVALRKLPRGAGSRS